MAAFTRANPLGWSVGSPVTSAQMNALDLDHVKSPNFVDGLATYNPAGLIQIGGAGFQWNAASAFASTSSTTWAGSSTVSMLGTFTVSATGSIVIGSSGEISVTSGGEITLATGSAMTWEDGSLVQVDDGATVQFADGSVLNLGGILNFGATSEIFGDPRLASGATLTAQSGSDVVMGSGSTLTAASGSTVTLVGPTTFASATWPLLSPARTWTRRKFCMAGTEEPTKVLEMCGLPMLGTTNTTFIRLSGTGPRYLTLLEIDGLPNGQTIASVVVRSVGYVGSPTITDEATYRVVRWTDETTIEAMSASVDDPHVQADWSTDVLETTLTITAHATIDLSYRYGVEVLSQNTSGGIELQIISVVATGTASSLRV